ncbi:hypothetical protein C9994_03905 [Marivirga lumbricoides]|uniref:Uncharacterized protein n=1 Tax=Marivirga lumbricoides TaxID=1046115 RepID=A0A2T4DTS3_9BACT|nr:hypothetical protein C9994_03905 [Marivirga lumbricoides]
MNNRQRSGDETWFRLREWTRGQKSSERLAGHIIRSDGFQSIDPSHPLGGKDCLKDIVCRKDSKSWVCGCYFPKSKQSFNQIKKKFLQDFKGVRKNDVDGFVFVTNQELSVAQKAELANQKITVEIYHLERIVSLLNSPICYGVRLEYLDISLTKEEQIAYFAERDKSVENFTSKVVELIATISSTQENHASIPIDKLQNFKSLLNEIVGNTNTLSLIGGSPIDKLRVPVSELREFRNILERIVGNDSYSTEFGLFTSALFSPISKLNVPVSEIREFEEILSRIVGKSNDGLTSTSVFNIPPIDRLQVPLNQLHGYEEMLDRIINKQAKLKNNQE